MYRVMYCLVTSELRFKDFESLSEATKFTNQQPIDSVIEIEYYEDCSNNRPTLRG